MKNFVYIGLIQSLLLYEYDIIFDYVEDSRKTKTKKKKRKKKILVHSYVLYDTNLLSNEITGQSFKDPINKDCRHFRKLMLLYCLKKKKPNKQEKRKEKKKVTQRYPDTLHIELP